MGNRAVIQMVGQNVGMYLHHNGGIDTVQPLLDVAKEYGVRGDDYGIARLAQMMGNFFGGTLSVGIATTDRLDRDNRDNGTYVINSQLDIVERLFQYYPEQQNHDYDGMKAQIKKANDSFFLDRWPSFKLISD